MFLTYFCYSRLTKFKLRIVSKSAMSKSMKIKSKPSPWVPPPARYTRQNKNLKKPLEPSKTTPDASPDRSTKVKHQEEDTLDLISLSSNSSDLGCGDFNLHLQGIKQEMKLLNMQIGSLKSSMQSLYRLLGSMEDQDLFVQELLNETKEHIREFDDSFEDLEYLLTLFENSPAENNSEQYAKILKCKENVFNMLLKAYEKIIIISQAALEKQNTKVLSLTQDDSLKKKLQSVERKCISQEAVVKDLERRLSIYQGKANALESYNTTLEETRSELQKQLSHREAQIKYLTVEVSHLSGEQAKEGHEKLIEIIEELRNKAHTEKSALKKALKVQRLYADKNEEKLKKQLEELKEKENMLFEIANQRDQLKIQLTVANNNVIQSKIQIEEVKNQNLKLQNELSEKDLNHKAELQTLKESVDEHSALLEKSAKEKLKLEFEQFTEAFEEMKHLVNLLQDTREIFQNLKSSPPAYSADNIAPNDIGPDNSQNNILGMVQDIKEELLELRKLYKEFIEEQKSDYKRTDTEGQSDELLHLYNATLKENEALKSEIEEIKNSSFVPPLIQRQGNYTTANMLGNDSFSRRLQMELMLKSEEIIRIKSENQQRERDLEDQLKAAKEKLQKQEIETLRIISLEEELKTYRQQLTILEKRRDEETERLLQRTKELQESLDKKTDDYESLQRYVQRLKSSYFRVFGGS